MESAGRWNDLNVTKAGKIMFSDRLIKHIVHELPTLVSEAKKSDIVVMVREDSGLS